MKKPKYQGYDKYAYQNIYRERRFSMQISKDFIKVGLTKKAIEKAADEAGVSPTAFWNAAGLLALKNPEAIRKIFRQKDSK